MDNNNNQNKNGKNPKGGQNYMVLIITMIFTLLCVSAMHNLWQQSRTQLVPYSEFNQMLKDGEVDSVVVSSNKIEITPKKDSKKYTGSQSKYGGLIGIEYYTILMYDPDLQTKLDAAESYTQYEQAQVDATASIIVLILEWVLPIGLMVLLLNFMMRRMGGGNGIMGVGKSNAKVYVQKETGVTFKDVAGEDEARNPLLRLLISSITPVNIRKSERSFPREPFL